MGEPNFTLGKAAEDENVCRVQPAGKPENSCHMAPSPGKVPPLIVTPLINLLFPVVLVKKKYTNPARRPVFLWADDSSFDGKGTFTFSTTHIRFFTAAKAGAEILSGHVFKGPELGAVVTLWAQGATPSGAMDDVHLQLALKPGSKPVNPPAKGTMTAVEVTLDIFKSRTDPAKEPTMLTVAEKTGSPGRMVHVQDAAKHHGRALLIVRKAVPAAFPGTLVLTGDNGELRVFKDPQEVGASGETAAPALPMTLPNGPIPATGTRLWVEGASLSPSAGHAGFHLGVFALDTDGDFVKMTSVQFSNLRAVINGTPAQPRRTAPPTANDPVPPHILTRTGGATAAHYSENDTDNRALVLIEGSMPASKFVALSVQISPAGIPVRWSVQRDVRTATKDHDDIIKKISPHATPTLSKDSGLTTNLSLDAVGTFHIRPYVDCNDNKTFEHNVLPAGTRIDREPFIIMNLILVRVQALDNSASRSDANQVTVAFNRIAGEQIRVRTHNLPGARPPWSAANKNNMCTHNNATAIVIGGGPAGTNGLDRVYAGWVNNELTVPSSITTPPGEDVVAEYLETPAPPPPPPPPARPPRPPAPITHRRISLWEATGGTFLPTPPPPPPAPVPTIFGGPFLDVSVQGGAGTGGNTCVGTEGAVGPPIPITPTARAVGQTWRVEMWDSPGDSAPVQHEGFPGTVANPIPMIRYRFNLDFRSDLVFWTNILPGSNPGATGDAADRLYVTVFTNLWFIRIAYRFNVTTGAATNTVTSINMRKITPANRLAIPCEGHNVQVRAPISLQLLGIDARK